ncbi:7-carboxy-7-deazaguanine synthase [wastewater metagenome]|uniref:7-carboxy-7-deazaguanine synthase n=2 Tax=unclassified sequences TaxID=12908 RepID=A0A5B8RKZ5_9ZZZZ|nr:anaerobic ribonucleoside-triphosphate reductase activating protein [Arhodomonas sp. KWT]QEA07687.1 7-carboxy-7-deazaguanine synthase [uncultured organism]
MTDRKPPAALRVAGLVPMTAVDLPGRLAAVVFCQGCPWACGYCHNPHLIPATGPETIGWPSVREFLRQRRGLLDGVVFSGGEPTLQRGLAHALAEVRSLGFETGLHTGGAYPQRLRRLLPEVDWVGFDVKTRFSDYERVTGVPGSGERARESLDYLLGSGVAYEVRTTVHPLVISPDGLLHLAGELAGLGVRHYAVQACRATGVATPGYRAPGVVELLETARGHPIERLFDSFQIRDT